MSNGTGKRRQHTHNTGNFSGERTTLLQQCLNELIRHSLNAISFTTDLRKVKIIKNEICSKTNVTRNSISY